MSRGRENEHTAVIYAVLYRAPAQASRVAATSLLTHTLTHKSPPFLELGSSGVCSSALLECDRPGSHGLPPIGKVAPPTGRIITAAYMPPGMLLTHIVPLEAGTGPVSGPPSMGAIRAPPKEASQIRAHADG